MVTWHASWLKIENEGNWYPGCQRVFMRGFRFRSSLKKCFATRVIALRPKKFLVAREKKPLVPSAGNCRRIYFLWINKLAFLIEDKHSLLPTFEINVYWPPPPPPPAFPTTTSVTFTSLLRPLFLAARQNDHTFSCNFLIEVQWTVIPNMEC